MPECRNCGGHVTRSFRRVFGDPETGDVHGCPSCMNNTDIVNGGTARGG